MVRGVGGARREAAAAVIAAVRIRVISSPSRIARGMPVAKSLTQISALTAGRDEPAATGAIATHFTVAICCAEDAAVIAWKPWPAPSVSAVFGMLRFSPAAWSRKPCSTASRASSGEIASARTSSRERYSRLSLIR